LAFGATSMLPAQEAKSDLPTIRPYRLAVPTAFVFF
jgi:hypothetical protein